MNELDLAAYISRLEAEEATGLYLDPSLTDAEARTVTETLRRRGQRVTVLSPISVVIHLTGEDE